MLNHILTQNHFLKIFKQCSGFGGSVINWPPGSGSVIPNYGTADPDPDDISGSYPSFFYRRFKEISEKVLQLINFNDFLPI